MTLSPQVLAVCSAVLFAGSHIASKRGVATTSVVGGLLISLSVGLLTLLAAVLLDQPSMDSLGAVSVFAAAGFFGPGLGRAGSVVGVHLLGPSISVPIHGSAYPLCAVAGAAVFLHEGVDVLRAGGCVAIVVGVWVLSRHGGEPAAPDLDGIPEQNAGRSAFRSGLIFPLAAGIGYGVADIIRKEGLQVLPEPAFGAFIGVAAALLGWLTGLAISPALRARLIWGRTAGWFAASGFMASLALLAQFHALRRGDVSVVSPIVAAQPLAVLLLSVLFLGGIERVTARVVTGAGVVVLGTGLLSV